MNQVNILEEKDSINQFITIDVRGFKYKVLKKKLQDYPSNSKLNQILTSNRKTNFYFDQDPFIFNSILNYSPNSKLHIFSSNECIKQVLDEYNFWFNTTNSHEYEFLFDSCCRLKLIELKEKYYEELNNEIEVIDEYYKKNKSINYGKIFPRQREFLWNLIDKPTSSFVYLFYNFTINSFRVSFIFNN